MINSYSTKFKYMNGRLLIVTSSRLKDCRLWNKKKNHRLSEKNLWFLKKIIKNVFFLKKLSYYF